MLDEAYSIASHLVGRVVVVVSDSHGTHTHPVSAEAERLDTVDTRLYLQTLFGGQRPWRQFLSDGWYMSPHDVYRRVVVVTVVVVAEYGSQTHEPAVKAATVPAWTEAL